MDGFDPEFWGAVIRAKARFVSKEEMDAIQARDRAEREKRAAAAVLGA